MSTQNRAKQIILQILIFSAALLLLPYVVLAQGYERGYADKVENAVRAVGTVNAHGRYQPAWESLKQYKIPAWYQDAKFGIFIHWGVYSVPAFESEWYPRNMYMEGTDSFKHHIESYGPQSQFGYKDFIPLFKAEKFDPDAWAELFRKAGAKYVIPVAEHHDGFPMYDCSFTDWSAAKMGPKRDVVGKLAVAVRKQGLHFGASSHRAEHWFFYEGGRKFHSDVNDARYLGLYGPAMPRRMPGADRDDQPDKAYMDNWLARSAEIVDKYQPETIWFDWWIEQRAWQPYLQKFAAYYYNRAAEWNRGVAINYKYGSFPDGSIANIQLLGSDSKLRWTRDASGLSIELPSKKTGQYAVVLKIS